MSEGVSISDDEAMRRIYRHLDSCLLPGEEPYDTEAGLARLLSWMAARAGISGGPVPAADASGGSWDWDAAAAAIPEAWVEAAIGHYSMHGNGLLRNILAGVEPLIRADESARRDTEIAVLREQLRQARAAAEKRPGQECGLLEEGKSDSR